MIKRVSSPSKLIRALSLALFALPLLGLQAREEFSGRILNQKLIHLGNDNVTITPGAPTTPDGERLDQKFKASKNKREGTFAVTYWDINEPAVVELNGHKLDSIPASKSRSTVYLRIPPGLLRNGENILSIIPKAKDDCIIGQIVLHDQPFRKLMQLETVKLSVNDAKNGKPIPALITIVDSNGKYSPIFMARDKSAAMRTGVIYVSDKETEIELPRGNYTFYATRGMEWSRETRSISITAGASQKAVFSLKHEVNTPGYIACDTHIHTLTFSGHGDASVEERMVTLAGEGVELAVATDHNHHTDYRPVQKQLGLTSHVTPVIGNEVSTKFGHINAFPMPRDGQIPNAKETNWVKLVDDIRFRGAKVVILNHPRWGRMDIYAGLGLNSLTGEQNVYERIPFDGVELLNYGVAEVGPVERFKEWFGLLNHGENIKAVGSSDSHTVFAPVGQGRTYIRSSTDNPAKIDVDEACANFLAGHSSISLGIFTDVTVETTFKPGDLVPVRSNELRVKLRVAAPSWVKPRRALVFLNGVQVAEKTLHPGDQAMDQLVDFSIPAPSHDAHLVCIATGDEVSEPFWRAREKFTVGATNPLFIDADNNGAYITPRETAQNLLARSKQSSEDRWTLLHRVDDGIAAQMLSLIYRDADSSQKAAINDRLQKESKNRPLFEEFLTSIQIAKK